MITTAILCRFICLDAFTLRQDSELQPEMICICVQATQQERNNNQEQRCKWNAKTPVSWIDVLRTFAVQQTVKWSGRRCTNAKDASKLNFAVSVVHLLRYDYNGSLVPGQKTFTLKWKRAAARSETKRNRMQMKREQNKMAKRTGVPGDCANDD